MKHTCTLFLLSLLLAGCASVAERAAHQTWEQERAQWFPDIQSRDGRAANLPELGPDATLDEYARYALLNNPGLRAAYARWKAALERVVPARNLEDPRFTYTYQVQNVETRVGPQEQRFGLAQAFPWPGKLDLNGQMALQRVAVEQRQYEAARNALTYQVRTAYCEIYYLERAIQVTADNVQLLTYLEEVARTRYQGGVAGHGAVIRIQVELGKLDDQLRSLRDQRRPAVARLNAALNRPAGAAVAAIPGLPEGGPLLPEEELLARAPSRNPELLALDAATAAEDLTIERARKDYFPDVMVSVDYILTSQAMAAVDDSGKDPLMAMVSINLPIWRDRYRAAVDEARMRRQESLRLREAQADQLAADLQMALFSLRDGERRIALYRDSLLPKAEQALGVVQQAFTAGEVDFLDLIDAQRSLLEFQLAYERARTDRAVGLAEIDMLVGGQITAVDPQE